MNSNIQVLDCTLRDGGQGLESRFASGIPVKSFTEDEKMKIAELTRDSGVDIVEIGSVSRNSVGQEHFAIYENIEQLSKFLPEMTNPNQLFTGLYIDPDTPLCEIPEYSQGLVEGIRVIMRYSQLQESIDFCAGLVKKGYKVFIQPMLTMRYTDEELNRLIEAANDMGAYALYFVDSFGYMLPKDIERLYHFYDKKLDKNIRIGFHVHNNMDAAFHNVCYFVERLVSRKCIIDACATGMGQGAGNMQTEVLLHYLNSEFQTQYRIDYTLEVCDMLEKFVDHGLEMWGYSPLQFVSVMHQAAYKYAVSMKIDYRMSLVQIHHALAHLQGDMRHRYTKENLEQLLKNSGQ